jgi:hypothetical protein
MALSQAPGACRRGARQGRHHASRCYRDDGGVGGESDKVRRCASCCYQRRALERCRICLHTCCCYQRGRIRRPRSCGLRACLAPRVQDLPRDIRRGGRPGGASRGPAGLGLGGRLSSPGRVRPQQPETRASPGAKLRVKQGAAPSGAGNGPGISPVTPRNAGPYRVPGMIEGHQGLISPIMTRDHYEGMDYGSICSIYPVRFAVSGALLARLTRNPAPSATWIFARSVTEPKSAQSWRRARAGRRMVRHCCTGAGRSRAAPGASCCYQGSRRQWQQGCSTPCPGRRVMVDRQGQRRVGRFRAGRVRVSRLTPFGMILGL